MPPEAPGPEPSATRIQWESATRIIASRFPPIDLFERVSPDPGVWEALIDADQLVNPRLRNRVGEISLVPAHERVSGPGASYIMASFTHVNPKGSRFSDGSYGVYYAAREFDTALRETVYHFEQFALDSRDGIRYEDMRVLVGGIDEIFHDIASLPHDLVATILDPNDYTASRPFGARLRESGSNGVVYPSVRNHGGECIGAFKPTAVKIPIQTRHIKYHFDGIRVVEWFDYQEARWFPL